MYRENNILYNDEQDSIIECLDKTIESFTVPKDIKFIYGNAFKDCYLLNTLCVDGNDDLIIHGNAFPEPSIKNLLIGNYNFIHDNAINVKNLKTITFLTSVHEIDSYLFYSSSENKTPNLEEIVIAEGNPFIKKERLPDFTKDGIWYQISEDKTIKMILYPPARKDSIYKIEDFVADLDDAAFSYNPYIKAVILPKGYKNPHHAIPFINCENLESIVILDKDVDPYVMSRGCKSFDKVYADVDMQYDSSAIKLLPIKNFAIDYLHSMKEINKFYKDLDR